MPLSIPKRLAHIWIGHRPPPLTWMQSWKQHHPDWDYVLYDNDFLFSRRWRHQDLITAFYQQGDYAGVSDLMRYQILHETGGFIPEADSICLRATDELWGQKALYTVFENEDRKPGFVSPFLASVPDHSYLHYISMRLKRRVSPVKLKPAWKSVGNLFLKKAMKARVPENTVIFPSYYFIPQHKGFERYQGDGLVYCDQLWGTTFDVYEDPPPGTDIDAMRAAHIERLIAQSDGQ